VDEAILSAAVELLGEVGYARLTVDQVAARAGVSKASLYLRWPGKVALVADALGYGSAVVPEVPDTGSLHLDMGAFLRELVHSHEAGFARAASAVSGEVASNPDLREAFRYSVIGTVSDRVRTTVARAVERGEVPATSDVELLSVLPMALLQHVRSSQEPRPDPEKVVERIVEQFYPPDATSSRRPRGAKPT
jgi:AcrR family transcriptional regulator